MESELRDTLAAASARGDGTGSNVGGAVNPAG
jgi:hypothetical protein